MGSMGMKDFLRHTGSTGGKREYLSGWADSKEGAVTVWLSKRAGITSIWRHPFPSLETKEDKGERHVEIWNKRYGCWEAEDVLQQQNKFDGGIRRVPPEVCGMCRLIEWVREKVEDGKMPFDLPLFHFEATGGKVRESTLFSAGMYNGYRQVSDAEKEVLKKAGVKYWEPWWYDVRAKLEYALIVVDDDDPKKGLQIAVEGSLLGQRIQSAIAKRMKDLGDEEGNPVVRPVAIRWEHFKNETEIQKKYDATIMTSVKLTPAIAKLLDEPPPDISPLTEKMNPSAMLARMQKHMHRDWVKQVPWDELFGPNVDAFKKNEAKKKAAGGEERPERAPEVGRAEEPRARAPEPPAAPLTPKGPPDTELARKLTAAGYRGPNWVEPTEADDGAVACDDCEQGIFVDWPVCPHCGKVYAEAAPPPPPPPKKFPSRSERAQASKPAPEAPPKSKEPDAPGGGNADDDLPF